MSKLLTTIAALQAVEQGLISLDDDISTYVPVFSKLQILTGFQDDGTPILENRKNTVTLQLLLTHSNGSAYDFLSPEIMRLRELNPRDMRDGPTVENRFNDPMIYEPGEGWAYGTGIAWAGKVIEAVSGLSLEDFMRRHLFEPLGINDITFFPQHRDDLTGRILRKGVRDESTGKLLDGPSGLAPLLGPSEDCFGGESLSGSLQDYIKVLHSILIDDGKLLKPETTALMFQPQLGSASKAGLKAAMENTDWVVGDFSGPNQYDWGLGGMLIDGNNHEWRNKGLLCWSGALNLFWFIDRTAGVCGVFGSQVWPPGDMLVERLMPAFEKEVYDRARSA